MQTGHYIVAHRNDGRLFTGTIEKIQNTTKGTLVVVKNNGAFKSFYLEDAQSYHSCDAATNPELVSYSELYRQVVSK